MKKKQGSKAWLRLEVKKGLYGDAVVEQKREGCTGIRCWKKWTETPSRGGARVTGAAQARELWYDHERKRGPRAACWTIESIRSGRMRGR